MCVTSYQFFEFDFIQHFGAEILDEIEFKELIRSDTYNTTTTRKSVCLVRQKRVTPRTGINKNSEDQTYGNKVIGSDTYQCGSRLL